MNAQKPHQIVAMHRLVYIHRCKGRNIKSCQPHIHDNGNFDYSKFTTGTDLERSKAISGAVNFIVAVDKEREREDFLREALMLFRI